VLALYVVARISKALPRCERIGCSSLSWPARWAEQGRAVLFGCPGTRTCFFTYPLGDPAIKKVFPPYESNEWHKVRVECLQGRIRVLVNRKLVNDLTGLNSRKGRICWFSNRADSCGSRESEFPYQINGEEWQGYREGDNFPVRKRLAVIEREPINFAPQAPNPLAPLSRPPGSISTSVWPENGRYDENSLFSSKYFYGNGLQKKMARKSVGTGQFFSKNLKKLPFFLAIPLTKIYYPGQF
jgi:hypothetical protein